MTEEYIWYCSYGSNLSFDRFKLYLFGGSLPLSEKTFPGCSEKVDPSELQKRFLPIPYEIYFASQVEFWDNMGVAFLEPEENASKKTYCRLYRISINQFHEIVQQENSVFRNPHTEIFDLEKLNRDKIILLGSEDENIHYGKIVKVGELEELPIVAFTAKWSTKVKRKSDEDKKNFTGYTKPSKWYLTTIIEGLLESEVTGGNKLGKDEIIEYLSSLKGISDGESTNPYSAEELKKIVDEVFENEPLEMYVQATGKVSRRGEFIVQVRENLFKKNGTSSRSFRDIIPFKYFLLKRKEYCLLKRKDKFIEIQAKVNYLKEEEIEENQINLDQKLRCALATEKGDSILVYPLRRKNKKFLINWRNAVERGIKSLLGIQYNLVRVRRSSYNDMEVNICRIKKETLDIVGIESGDVVVIESPYARVRRRALELTKDTFKEMEDRRKSNDNNDFNCKKLLKIERLEGGVDMQPILLDFDTRNKLKIGQCAPVRIRRSLIFEITKRLHLISTPLILTVIVILLNFGLPDWVKSLIVVMGLLVIFTFIIFNVRMKVE